MIEQFQRRHGLKVDGIIGKNTIQAMMEAWAICDNAQIAHFLGQTAHETMNFTATEENLNYSGGALLRVFGKYFTREEVREFAYKPQKIANRTYGGRMGNYKPNDGWKFRGRGAIMLTGRDNYERFAQKMKDLSILENPEQVSGKYFWKAGLYFFDRQNIWNLAHQVNDENITKISIRINGGHNGLKDRIEKTNYYYSLI